jgi:hypothetical protein
MSVVPGGGFVMSQGFNSPDDAFSINVPNVNGSAVCVDVE